VLHRRPRRGRVIGETLNGNAISANIAINAKIANIAKIAINAKIANRRLAGVALYPACGRDANVGNSGNVGNLGISTQ
jgi:hypothetical protein